MSKKYCDLIYKLVVVVSLEYLLFFGLEAILPGIIIGVFNTNILLILVVILLGALLSVRKCQGVFVESGQNKFLKLLMGVASIFLVLVMIIIWHRVGLILSIFYILVSFLASYLLWKNI